MGMPVLIMSDIHFHTYKAHSSLIDGVNSRLLHQVEAWRQAVDAGVARGCRLLLIAGDVFELRGSIKPSVFNRVTSLVMETMERGFDIGVVPGNHDLEHLEAGESAVDSWDYLKVGSDSSTKMCTVFKKPEVKILAGHRVLGIPYIHDTEVFKEVFSRFSTAASPDITMIHQGIDDFNGNGMYPRTGITAEWIEAHNPGIVVCGHYHKPDLSKGGRVVNVGALVQHRFSDEGSERGCWVLGNGAVEFVRIRSPRFVTVEGAEDVRGGCEDAIVRIRAKSAREADRLKRKAREAGALSVVVEIEKEFKTAHEKTIRMGAPRAMLSEYLDLVDKYRSRKEEIVSLFDRICLG